MLTHAQQKALRLIVARADYMLEKHGGTGRPACRGRGPTTWAEGTCGVVHVAPKTAQSLVRGGMLVEEGDYFLLLTPAGREAVRLVPPEAE